ncbi:MAG TPA: hypothetical protein VGV59_00595 [Pyrinomonadaceae bacterium]|nr:hypothetical protein [Pyrinomonadaceae bacterium]
MSDGGLAFTMLVLFFAVGLVLLIKYTPSIPPERRRGVGGIYLMFGMALILGALALMNFVRPLLVSPRAVFLDAFDFGALLVGVIGVFSGIILLAARRDF